MTEPSALELARSRVEAWRADARDAWAYRPPVSEYGTARGSSDDGYLGPTGLFATATPKRRYATLVDDPYCTDASFFASGRYRPTGYAPYDRNQAPNYVPRREPRRGPYTGAAQPEYPRVNRKFGNNTRASVMPFRRYTHMRETGYDDDVVGSKSVPSFLNPAAALGQSGSEAVLAAAGLTRVLGVGKSRSKHFLLDGPA